MKPRLLVIAAASAAALVLVGAISAPSVANWMAEAEVDKALRQVRERGTAVAYRGDVAADIWTRTVVVRDVAVDSPGADGAKVRVGRITIERPGKDDGRITAARVRFDDVVLTSGAETMSVPSIDVLGYDGPAEGLVGASGVGKAVRTQADVMEQVSIDSATIPRLTVANGRLGASRTATDVRFGRMTDGLVSRASVGRLDLKVEERTRRNGETRGGFALSTSDVVAESLRLPALLRFQAGDGAGEREPAFARASIAKLEVDTPTGTLGRVQVSVEAIEATDLFIRPLAFTTKAIEAMEERRREDEAPTPAETRQRLLLLTDLVRAFGVGKITATAAAWSVAPPDGHARSGKAATLEFEGYADGALERASVRDARVTSELGEASVADASVAQFDASGLVAYAERVGRDQALLTTAPPPAEILKLSPRVGRIAVAGVAATTANGEAMSVGSVRTGARGGAEAVPNRIGLVIENLRAPVPQDFWFTPYLDDAGIEQLNLSFRLVMSLDPTTKILTLDGLDYADPGVGDVKLTGALAGVDPGLAVASGGELIQKLSEVTLQPFTLRIEDRGGVKAGLAAAARAQGEPAETYGDTLATEAGERLTDVLGPSAVSSATALGLFLREGGVLEATINPRTPDTPLLDLFGLRNLGPTGWAQALDVTIVNRAE